MKKSLIIIFILIINSRAYSQLNELLFDNIFEALSKETSVSIDVETIEHYRNKPINLATAKKEDILALPSMTYHDAVRIYDYIKNHNQISIRQLADSLNLTSEQELILDACTYTSFPYNRNYKPKQLFYRVRNQNYLSKIYGIEKNKFQGSALNLYQRLYYDNDKFSTGVLIDKDCGEISMLDFWSAYASYRDKRFKIVIGDYNLELGLGNIFWKPMGNRKGTNVIAPALEIGQGIRPYRSTIDYNYFRGIAGTYNFYFNEDSKLSFTSWYSNINRSSTIDTMKNIATSIYTTGYFRTQNEISKKSNLNEVSYGGDLKYESKNYILGISSIFLNYEIPIVSSSSSAFNGNKGILSTAYGLLNFDKSTLGTEFSLDSKNNFAFKTSYQIFYDALDIALHFRYYPEEFRSPFGYNFGEFSYPANETGIYASALWKVTNILKEKFYIDLYKSNGPTYFVPDIVRGIDIFNETELLLGNNLFAIRLRGERKTDAKKNQSTQQYDIFYTNDASLRIDWNYKLNRTLNSRIRLELTKVIQEKIDIEESGWGTYFEINYNPNKYLKVSPRIAFFNTDSYASAVWFFEYALPGLMSTQALYGKGLRGILNIKISPVKYIDINLRYSITYKPFEESLGSGYLEVLENKDHRLYLQLDFTY